jgi:mono/diheme cytochrome c family protein
VILTGSLLVACASASRSNPEPPQLPCDIGAVFRDVCQKCHTAPPENGAPISLVTYADTQAPFTEEPTYHDTPVYIVMGDALSAGVMPPPKSGVSITQTQRDAILAWVGAGAPPAPEGTHCP